MTDEVPVLVTNRDEERPYSLMVQKMLADPEVKDLRKRIKGVMDEAKNLQGRFSLLESLLLKDAVFTEVSHYAARRLSKMEMAQFHNAILYIHGMDTDWWFAGEKLTVAGWYSRILDEWDRRVGARNETERYEPITTGRGVHSTEGSEGAEES